MSSSNRNIVPSNSRESGDLDATLERINLLASPSQRRLQAFMNVYRHLSTFDIKWDTNLISIPEASYEQIQELIRRKTDYPKVQEALQLMELGDGPFLNITIADNQSDKYGHAIMAYGRTTKGVRRLVICEFRQCSSLSPGGLLGTAIVGVVTGYFYPPAGILGFIAKVAADYALSKQDVSVIVAIKELVRIGVLRLNETTMRIDLA